jgi:hypothetical protein|tara:strand:+ start:206 stop:802 length:597 start_codon:yes stop_codon:yes gene_type:complete
MLGSVAEQIENLIKKEARRQIIEREKEIKEQTAEQTREQKEHFNEKLKQAVHDHKDQHTRSTRDIIDKHREQINNLKSEYKSKTAKLERENHDYKCKVIDRVSSMYSIPIKIVRRDLAPEDDKHCLGIRKNGKMCNNKAIRDGYCCVHVDEPRPCTPILMPRGPLRHTHPFPSGLVTGCPACSKKIVANEFRDLPSII